jgi:hypothetical protein
MGEGFGRVRCELDGEVSAQKVQALEALKDCSGDVDGGQRNPSLAARFESFAGFDLDDGATDEKKP